MTGANRRSHIETEPRLARCWLHTLRSHGQIKEQRSSGLSKRYVSTRANA